MTWVVRLGNDLYTRSSKGRTTPWFRRAQARQDSYIQTGGVGKDVTFVEQAGPAIGLG